MQGPTRFVRGVSREMVLVKEYLEPTEVIVDGCKHPVDAGSGLRTGL